MLTWLDGANDLVGTGSDVFGCLFKGGFLAVGGRLLLQLLTNTFATTDDER